MALCHKSQKNLWVFEVAGLLPSHLNIYNYSRAAL